MIRDVIDVCAAGCFGEDVIFWDAKACALGFWGAIYRLLGIPVLILDLSPCIDRRSWVHGGHLCWLI